MTTIAIPIFPLHTVLFPYGTLPLRIFEPRYLEMVSACMKTEQGFGICLIRSGSEVGEAAQTYETGTLSEISYFNQQADGLLGITASGKQRFHIIATEIQPNQLTIAEVELIPNEEPTPIPDKYRSAVDILKRIFENLGYPFAKIEKHYDDASWVGSRLAEFLPISLEQKQYLLQLNDPLKRLDRVWSLLESLELR
ncbi:LON peptidase substrate-binding domain-containing protein [Kaarinaea lacus]